MHYIPYVNNIELLVKSYNSARLIEDVTILDNRGHFNNQPDPAEHVVLEKHHRIQSLPISLTTAQIMNYMLYDAITQGNSFFSWQHGDIEYDPKLGPEFIKYAFNINRPDWGILYTDHDLVAAYNVEALKRVNGWDQYSFPYYFLDNDIACRLDYAGYKMLVKDFGYPITHYASTSINSDRYRLHVSGLLFPICEQLLKERHDDHKVINIDADAFNKETVF